MRRFTPVTRLALTAAVVLSPCVVVCHGDQKVPLLLNGGAEQGKGGLPSVWYAARVPADGLRMWWETKRAHAGKGALGISNEHQYEQPVSNNWAQRLQYLPRGKVIRLSAYIRTEHVDAVNVCVQCWSARGERMLAFASTPMFRGTHNWVFANSDPIVVPPETTSMIVRAALTGKGKAFFDDISIEIVGSPAPIPGDVELDKAVPGRVLRALPVTKDCMILAYLPTWSYGDLDNIAVANNGGGVRTLLSWSPVPPEEATRGDRKFILGLYSRKTRFRGPGGVIAAHELLGNWRERTSWETQPPFDPKPLATFKFIPGDGWKLFDVTSFVRALSKGEWKTHGIILRFTEEDRSGEADGDSSGYSFVSREGLGKWEARRPLLLVVDPRGEPTTQPRRKTSSEDLLQYLEHLASLPGTKIESVPGSPEAYFDATRKANLATGREIQANVTRMRKDQTEAFVEGIPYYERYIDRYPLTPHGIRMMNLLGCTYARVGRYDDARRILRAAIALAKDDSFANILEIDLAHVETVAGGLDAAEVRLRRMMAKPVPESLEDSNAFVPQLFIAPEYLAKVYQKRGEIHRADRILYEAGERALVMAGRNPNVKGLLSYVAGAYMQRISLVLETDPGNIDAARMLAEEFKQRLPDYKGVPGYAEMLSSIRYQERLLEQGKGDSPPEAGTSGASSVEEE